VGRPASEAVRAGVLGRHTNSAGARGSHEAEANGKGCEVGRRERETSRLGRISQSDGYACLEKECSRGLLVSYCGRGGERLVRFGGDEVTSLYPQPRPPQSSSSIRGREISTGFCASEVSQSGRAPIKRAVVGSPRKEGESKAEFAAPWDGFLARRAKQTASGALAVCARQWPPRIADSPAS